MCSKRILAKVLRKLSALTCGRRSKRGLAGLTPGVEWALSRWHEIFEANVMSGRWCLLAAVRGRFRFSCPAIPGPGRRLAVLRPGIRFQPRRFFGQPVDRH